MILAWLFFKHLNIIQKQNVRENLKEKEKNLDINQSSKWNVGC